MLTPLEIDASALPSRARLAVFSLWDNLTRPIVRDAARRYIELAG